MYSVYDVAEYIIWRETKQKRPVSNLRLQKLLYFVQAYFLCTMAQPCFDSVIEAWDFGPVVPEIYHEYKIYGSSCIPAPQIFDLHHFRSDDLARIDTMLDQCASQTTNRLVTITHAQDPWRDAYQNPFGNRITNDAIIRYYRGEKHD